MLVNNLSYPFIKIQPYKPRSGENGFSVGLQFSLVCLVNDHRRLGVPFYCYWIRQTLKGVKSAYWGDPVLFPVSKKKRPNGAPDTSNF